MGTPSMLFKAFPNWDLKMLADKMPREHFRKVFFLQNIFTLMNCSVYKVRVCYLHFFFDFLLILFCIAICHRSLKCKKCPILGQSTLQLCFLLHKVSDLKPSVVSSSDTSLLHSISTVVLCRVTLVKLWSSFLREFQTRAIWCKSGLPRYPGTRVYVAMNRSERVFYLNAIHIK